MSTPSRLFHAAIEKGDNTVNIQNVVYFKPSANMSDSVLLLLT
jgi:hypothetical protein